MIFSKVLSENPLTKYLHFYKMLISKKAYNPIYKIIKITNMIAKLINKYHQESKKISSFKIINSVTIYKWKTVKILIII